MKWGLTQGMIGRKLASLMPSATAMGPNTYLSQQDFLKMMGVAFVVHALIFIIAALVPREEVTNIPVRALSFKLGDMDRVAALGAPTGVSMTMNETPPAPVMRASNDESWHATPSTPSAAVPAPLKPVAKPHSVQPAPTRAPTPKVIPITEPKREVPIQNRPMAQPTPQPIPLSPPAIAPTPQQYVREVGNPTAQMIAALPSTGPLTGLPDGNTLGQGMQNTSAQTEQAIRETYERQIARWVEMHRFYPAAGGGRQGRVVLRIRIDRGGTVRYAAVEESSHIDILDATALEMIRLANPMPATPANYPPGNPIEFLIPINLRPLT